MRYTPFCLLHISAQRKSRMIVGSIPTVVSFPGFDIVLQEMLEDFNSNNFANSSIDHNEKDGNMYILPECIADIKQKDRKRCQETLVRS